MTDTADTDTTATADTTDTAQTTMPVWFIGGPLNGQDRNVTHPEVGPLDMIAQNDENDITWRYAIRTFYLGAEVFICSYDARYTPPEMVITLWAELIKIKFGATS